MPKTPVWKFKRSFKANAFGCRSSKLACDRIREAVAEIQRVAGKDPVLAGEGAVLFLERLSPAVQDVDSSSGTLGTASHHAVEELVEIVLAAGIDEAKRSTWMDRLNEAVEADGFGYLEPVRDRWGELCWFPGLVTQWADRLVPFVRQEWSSPGHSYVMQASMALSCLVVLGKHEEIEGLLSLQDRLTWSCGRFLAESLVRKGQVDAALDLAAKLGREGGSSGYGTGMAGFCEQVLIGAGRREEAYRKYARAASTGHTYLEIFRDIARRYPEVPPRQILIDQMAQGPKGKWFAAAKEAGFLDLALQCADHPTAVPSTLVRAVRDYHDKNPEFALTVAVLAVGNILNGSGYDPTTGDIVQAYHFGLRAASKVGKERQFLDALQEFSKGEPVPERRMMKDALTHCLNSSPGAISHAIDIFEKFKAKRGKGRGKR